MRRIVVDFNTFQLTAHSLIFHFININDMNIITNYLRINTKPLKIKSVFKKHVFHYSFRSYRDAINFLKKEIIH